MRAPLLSKLPLNAWARAISNGEAVMLRRVVDEAQILWRRVCWWSKRCLKLPGEPHRTVEETTGLYRGRTMVKASSETTKESPEEVGGIAGSDSPAVGEINGSAKESSTVVEEPLDSHQDVRVNEQREVMK
jgi:hypothetical protein